MRFEVGEIWIAKFSELGDRLDRQRCELAYMQMAADIGITVAPSRVSDTVLGSVLLKKRLIAPVICNGCITRVRSR